MAQSSANHRETCRQGGSYMTYDGTKDVERHVAAVFVRRTSTGSLEAYIPSFFGEAQRQIEQSFQKALDNMQARYRSRPEVSRQPASSRLETRPTSSSRPAMTLPRNGKHRGCMISSAPAARNLGLPRWSSAGCSTRVMVRKLFAFPLLPQESIVQDPLCGKGETQAGGGR